MDKSLTVLYEDNHLVVCKKPVGVLSQGAGNQMEDMLWKVKQYIKEKYAKPGEAFIGLVHRLDLNVGGIMVFARTSKAASRLSHSIREHVFQKTYLATVEGILPIGSLGTLIDYLEKDEANRIGIVSQAEGGKKAELAYTVLANGRVANIPCSLVEIRLKTGRFHQIRVQFSAFGYPLLNDVKYHATKIIDDYQIGLYASKLEFPHPITGEMMAYFLPPEGPLFASFQEYFPTNC